MQVMRRTLLHLLVFSVLGVPLAARAQTPLEFVAVTPCRLLDTRPQNGGGGPIQGGTFETFFLPQLAQAKCGADLSLAVTYSLNITVVPHGSLGYLTVWPTGLNQPVVSTLNSLDGRIKANAAIVPASSGAISAFVTDTTDLIIDINGYFVNDISQLAFYQLPPCRVADTRSPSGPLGGPYLSGGMPRDFPILASSCLIPVSAQAYSFNFTAVPRGGQPVGYLTVWPANQSRPLVSTLNALTGTITANAAIVPAGNGGDIEVFASNDTDLVIDVNGYFAPQSSAGLSLYALPPCRVLDTRQGGNLIVGELTVNEVDQGCAPQGAQAYVFNATVVPSSSLGYLTLWPDALIQPKVSTLNALDGIITSNMAIVPTGNGAIDAYPSSPTHLVLDIFSYFASINPIIQLPPGLLTAKVNMPFNYQLIAVNGFPPYFWDISLTFPPGLNLDDVTGLIYGTPTQLGTYSFTVKCIDSQQGSTSTNLSIIVQ